MIFDKCTEEFMIFFEEICFLENFALKKLLNLKPNHFFKLIKNKTNILKETMGENVSFRFIVGTW